MADIRPFRGWRYNPAKVSDLSQVITQPYDKIPRELQQKYVARHPNSFVHLILPAAAEPYSYSNTTCRQWAAQGILVRDTQPHAVVVFNPQ